MKNKMTITELKQYIIAESKKLMKAEMLKEEKKRIVGQLKKLDEGFDVSFSGDIESIKLALDKFGFSLIKDTPDVLQYEKPIKGISDDVKLVFYYSVKQNTKIAMLVKQVRGITVGHGVEYVKNSKQLNDILLAKLGQGPMKSLDEGDEGAGGNTESLRAMLHTLVGNEVKLGKRADMYGGVSHHVEEHKKAEKELEIFLLQNPSMMDFVEEVEDHFLKRPYR